MKHTPGPWKFFRTERLSQYAPHNKHADLWIIESDSRKSMATLELWELNLNPKWRAENARAIAEREADVIEIEANARLIAAAPDLLAALQIARGYVISASMNPVSITAETILTDVKTINAAIAKATQ